MTTYLPDYFTRKAILLYVVLLIICSIALFGRGLPLHWVGFGLVEVVCFFYFSSVLTKQWHLLTPVTFRKRLFSTALIIRLVYVVFSYFFYIWMTGQPFEFEVADAKGYHEEAIWLLSLVKNDQLPVYIAYINGNYSDMGYVSYLTAIYSVFGDGLMFPRLLKALYSAFTCVLVYKLATRNFGEGAGRIAGVLALLSPNLIYYCGLHLKETEMVFLTVFFLERADLLIRESKFNYGISAATLLLGISLFFFRTVLGATAFLSLFLGFILYSGRGAKVSIVRKLGFVVTLVALGLLMQGGRIESEVAKYWGDRDTNQEASMKARANSSTGNTLAKYGSAAVFAPLIIAAPFPTLVNIETQQNQMLLNGGYYTRNVMAFFVLLALILLWKRRQFRQHLLPISFLFSYLAVLALSKFALSERFHLPILPVFFVLASFGVTQLTRKSVKYYLPYLGLIALIILAWNTFKIIGRGGLE